MPMSAVSLAPAYDSPAVVAVPDEDDEAADDETLDHDEPYRF